MLLFAFESRLFSMLLGSKLYEANGFSFGESVTCKFREYANRIKNSFRNENGEN